MAQFMIHFIVYNVMISIVLGMLLVCKYLLKNILTPQMQYRLWYLFLGLLTIPFLPVRQIQSSDIFLYLKSQSYKILWIWDAFLEWLESVKDGSASSADVAARDAAALTQPNATAWMNDFSISVSRKTPSMISSILCAIWIIGIFTMFILFLKSMLRFHAIKKSALPLQNITVHNLYHNCLTQMHITKNIPIYSTAFLKSPIITGLFKPSIYLPIHLICDSHPKDIRYILLHELQHYKHKDALANGMMNLAGALYWFNPFVWYALKEMKNDREIACDTSVLKMLDQDDYEDYGITLINFAEKLSLNPFPFSSGISSSMAQMQKRILNIATYHPASFSKNIYSIFSYFIITILLLGFVPILSIQVIQANQANDDRYNFKEHGKRITYIDRKADFGDRNGSFVLYDSADDSWQIYNKEYATTRITPASTYKIYSALFGLESKIIAPEQSLISWNGQPYSFDSWNADQTLESAMQNSVNWYFQSLDQQAGLSSIKKYIHAIGYGNQDVGKDLSSYWLNTLKISPVEQVEMLQKFFENQFHFSPENIEAVKNSICISSTNEGTLYGKTGTEAVNGQNTSGWFIGTVEKDGHTYFFATNIQNEKLATGSAAASLTFKILSDLNIIKQ